MSKNNIEIIDLTPEHENLYFCCLEDWNEEVKEAGNHKQLWHERMKEKGLRVKLARDESGVIGGMIQYMPIEHSIFEGKNLYTVLCIWVHGHKQGRGNFQKSGMGTALLRAAEEDCKSLGANGLVTWGLLIPVFMRASWFRRKGYKVVEKFGMMRLLWKPFVQNAKPPKFIRPKKTPEKGKEKVNVSIFKFGWCTAMNMVYERAIRASKEFEGKVEVSEYDTTNKELVNEWGITDALFIDGKEVNIGPPPSYKKIRRKIARRVKRIKN